MGVFRLFSLLSLSSIRLTFFCASFWHVFFKMCRSLMRFVVLSRIVQLFPFMFDFFFFSCNCLCCFVNCEVFVDDLSELLSFELIGMEVVLTFCVPSIRNRSSITLLMWLPTVFTAHWMFYVFPRWMMMFCVRFFLINEIQPRKEKKAFECGTGDDENIFESP